MISSLASFPEKEKGSLWASEFRSCVLQLETQWPSLTPLTAEPRFKKITSCSSLGGSKRKVRMKSETLLGTSCMFVVPEARFIGHPSSAGRLQAVGRGFTHSIVDIYGGFRQRH